MVENVADDGVEPKLVKIEASGVASGSVKPNVDVKFKVKIPFQAHIGHIEENPKPVSTGHIEEKPKPVRTGVRGIELDTDSFFYNKWKMERATRFTWLGSSTSGKGRIYYFYR